MINRRIIIGIILFIVGGLVVFTFANPGPDEEPVQNNQEEIDLANQIAAAIEAVEKAEDSLIQADVDAALVLVNALPNGTDKDELLARLEAVQEQIDLANQTADAAIAVELAETTKSQTDVDFARGLVTALPESTIKTGLLNRLDAVQADINLRNQTAAATAAVEEAEDTTSQADVNSADTLVVALPLSATRTSLLNRLAVVQGIINLRNQFSAATAAVVAAETSTAQVDVNSANTLVAALPGGTTKTDLLNRLSIVQGIINLRNQIAAATEAVVAAETSTAQADVNSANNLVASLPESTTKTNLLNRLVLVQGIINLREAKLSAIASLNTHVTGLGVGNYTEANWIIITAHQASGVAAINASTTTAEVQIELDKAIFNVDSILTILENAKLLAIAHLSNIVELLVEEDYSTTNWAIIEAYLAEGIDNINAATTVAEVRLAHTEASNKIALVKTLAIELAEAKVAAKAELNTYFGNLNHHAYFNSEWNDIVNFKDNGLVAIDAAMNIASVDAALALAIANIDNVETMQEVINRIAFENYKNAKIFELNAHVWLLGESNYLPANWTIIGTIKTTGINNINSGTTYAEVNQAFDNAKAEMATVVRLTWKEVLAINAVEDYENASGWKKPIKKLVAKALVNDLDNSSLKTELLARLAA